MTTDTRAPDDATVIDFSAIFNNYIAASQKNWEHDRSQTLGASEVFDCLRKAWFSKRGKEFGHKPDDVVEDWGAMRRGDIIENYYVVEGMKHLPPPLNLLFAGDDQKTLVLNKNSATPDGLIVGIDPNKPIVIYGAEGGKRVDDPIVIENPGANCVCFEIKSIDPRANLIEERQKHHGQTQVQLWTFRELTQWKPNFSIILYIDASFLSKLTPFVVEFDKEKAAAARMRAEQLWQIEDPLMIVPEGKFDGSCDHCKWKTACGEATFSRIKQMNEATVDPEHGRMIVPLVDEYLKARDERDKAEEAFGQKAERLKELLLDINLRKFATNLWTLAWSPVKGKVSLDTEAMERDGIDLKRYHKIGASYDRLTVTRKAKKKE